MLSRCRKNSLWQAGLALAAGLTVAASSWALEHVEMPGWGRVLVAVGPAPVYGVLVWAMVRGVRLMDELQRRMMLEALAFGFAGGWVAAVVYEQLAEADVGLPHLTVHWTLFLFVILWVGGYAAAARRYR
ncbi:MAG: hypothetical protein D6693_00465 [Planctomycetota bacterium]|nr:MAG: hypothetical protein D6693_00465 [Planctomycetota bacterium]